MLLAGDWRAVTLVVVVELLARSPLALDAPWSTKIVHVSPGLTFSPAVRLTSILVSPPEWTRRD